MSRTLKLGGALVALTLTLAACSGPTATQTPAPTSTVAPSATAMPSEVATPTAAPTDGANPTPTASPTLPPAASEGTLTIWADATRAPVFTQVAQAFTAQYNVPVQVYEIGFGQIRDGLIQNGPAGEGPDIIIGASDWLGKLVTAGVLEPIDLGDKATNFEQSGLDAFTYQGADGTAHLYGLPYVSEAIALYYNKDLVPTPPTTWDELKQMALDLQDAGTVTQAFCMQRGDPYHTEPILTGFGGYVFGTNADGSYNPDDLGLDSAGGLAYAEELDAMVKAGILVDNVDYGACASQMENATTPGSAMWITGPWELNNFISSGINYGVAPIPQMAGQPRPFVGVQGMMVSSFGPNKEIAKAFLTEYIATDETMRSLWEADKRIPTWKPVETTVMAENADLAAFADSAANGNPLPAIPQMDSVWTAWTNAINLIFAQSGDPDQAITDAATQIRDLISGS